MLNLISENNSDFLDTNFYLYLAFSCSLFVISCSGVPSYGYGAKYGVMGPVWTSEDTRRAILFSLVPGGLSICAAALLRKEKNLIEWWSVSSSNYCEIKDDEKINKELDQMKSAHCIRDLRM